MNVSNGFQHLSLTQSKSLVTMTQPQGTSRLTRIKTRIEKYWKNRECSKRRCGPWLCVGFQILEKMNGWLRSDDVLHGSKQCLVTLDYGITQLSCGNQVMQCEIFGSWHWSTTLPSVGSHKPRLNFWENLLRVATAVPTGRISIQPRRSESESSHERSPFVTELTSEREH